MTGRAEQALRGVGLGRVAVGLLTLAALGHDDLPLLAGLPAPARTAARVLAVRDLVQGAALAALPAPRVGPAASLGSGVDALHAASMTPLVAFSRRYRAGAAASGLSALAWVALTAAARRT